MSTPNRRIAVERGKNPSKASRRTGGRPGSVEPSANAWSVLERKKGRGAARLEEVGELVIASIPAEIRTDVLNTLANSARTAESRDPNHQVLSFATRGAGVRITTAENQMPVRIGKKLHASFKGGTLTISYSDRDMPVRVRWIPPAGR